MSDSSVPGNLIDPKHLGVHTPVRCAKSYFYVPTHGEVEMTSNPQVPVVKHLLEQAERNAHLKETFTKSQNLKYVYFFSFYKQDRTKIIKIISAKDFSTIVAS